MGVEGKVIAGRGAPLSFPIPSAASKASFTHPFYLLSSLGERINLPQVPSPPRSPGTLRPAETSFRQGERAAETPAGACWQPGQLRKALIQ